MKQQVSLLLDDVVRWATDQPTVTGIALVGSHARGAAGPGSDVDLVLLSRAPRRLVADASWVHFFGEVASCDEEDWGAVTSLRVVYGSGLEVEFGLTTPSWADVPPDAGTRRVVADGMKVLYDPDGVLGTLQRAVPGS